VFRNLIPIDVARWVSDWEGREGLPLALLPYMQRGGALRVSVSATEVV
jgi:hypothetical protein